MADASATYTLKWGGGDFTARANEASAAAQGLASSMKGLQSVSQSASKAAGGVKVPKALTPKPKEPEEFRKKLEPLTKALRVFGVDLGPVTEGSSALGGALKTPAFAAIGATVAIVALVAAIVAGVAAFAAYALGAADAARSTRLLAEAATGGAKAGGVLLYQAAQLARVTGLTEQQLQQMGLGLARNGLAGQRLADVFETVAIASSAMGDAAGSKIASIAEEAQKTRRIVLNMFNLQGTGVTIDEVAKALAARAKVPFAVAKGALQDGRVKVDAALDALNRAVKTKLGALAEKQALALPKQIEQAKANISKLFAGVNVDPALGGLKQIFSIFDQNTVAGKALAKVLGSVIGVVDGRLREGRTLHQDDVPPGMVIGATGSSSPSRRCATRSKRLSANRPRRLRRNGFRAHRGEGRGLRARPQLRNSRGVDRSRGAPDRAARRRALRRVADREGLRRGLSRSSRSVRLPVPGSTGAASQRG
jgi:hypothetical protein